MSRQSPLILPALIVAIGVTVSAWPLRGLFEVAAWQEPLLVTTLAVAATGAAIRPVARHLAPLAQTAVLLSALVLLFGRETTHVGIPTRATVDHAVALYADAVNVIATSPAPAPTTPGIVFVLTTGFALVALLADIAGVTYRRPLLAAVPLLVPYLTAVANVGTALPWYHLAAVVAVVGLLLWDGHARAVDRWLAEASAGRQGTASRAAPRSLSATALGAIAVVAALTLAAALPHMPTRYVADGLGRSGSAQVGFTPAPDLLSDLSDDDDTPVLRYTTDDPLPPPIKVSVARTLADGGWVASETSATPSDTPSFPPPAGLGSEVPRTPQTMDVRETRLEAPFLATPAPVIAGTVVGAAWALDAADQVVVVDERPRSYSMQYLTFPGATGGDRLSDVTRLREDGIIDASDLDTAASTPLLRETLREVTATATTPAERADAISRWLRTDQSFTYSLTLPEGGGDPIDDFLTDRVGYCVQFSTVMVLMAREEGIPARMVTGFLPGVPDGDERVVRARDAHAWPELYLEELGWVRYEATPAVRAGVAPRYGPAPEVPEATGTDVEPEPVSPQEQASPRVDRGIDPDQDAAGTTPDAAEDEGAVAWPLLGVMLLVLLAGLAVAALLLAPAIRHRRRLAAAASPADHIEEHWRRMEARLTDLEFSAPVSATPRERARLYASQLAAGSDDPEAAESLAAVTGLRERARYSPVPVSAEEAEAAGAHADRVVAAARRGADRQTRWRAAWTPSDGIFAGRSST
ncbi:MAG: DUF3488 and transglutaminase-like domain-containing protein [Mobilicoccus sp.]|nr:DUF3488 and transglutaminase-like domain-containing protein [Mobilicoccus sp.]